MLQRPIFIGGISGTGKSILRLMLSAHSNIALTRRLYFWPRFYKRFGDLQVLENFEQCLTAILQDEQSRYLNPDPARIRTEFFRGHLTYSRLFGVILRQHAELSGKQRWGVQLGFIERYATDIFSSYPDASMLHMIRDPSDRYEQFRSMSRRKFGLLGRSTADWLASVYHAQNNRHQHPQKYLLIQYEELTTSPRTTLIGICEFLGEEVTDEMLTSEIFQKIEIVKKSQSRSGSTANYEARHKIARINIWVNLDTAFSQAITKRRMLALNYHLKDVNLSFLSRVFFYSLFYPFNLIIVFLWRLRYRNLYQKA